jgi:[glutamine synthetase] adenylyltransferase / [glutamine synthetase]-adenylyl-L-tyrosine phosphorylase
MGLFFAMTRASADPAAVPVEAREMDAFPSAMQAQARNYWRDYVERAAASALVSPGEQFQAALQRVASLSRFVAASCLGHPDLPLDLWNGGDVHRSYAPEDHRQRLRPLLVTVQDQTQLAERVRRFRRREMVRIAWRDLMGWSSLAQTTQELSSLAEAVLESAVERLHQWQCRELGVPVGRGGRPQELVVIAMGKLGAGELNFSSDIDLIFAFREEGQVEGGKRSLGNQEFFIKLGQRLIQVLSAQTPDGLAFRVDMRLRPFGDSGPLAMSFEAMEAYYQTHGREWERYAWIKARAVAGDKAAGADLLASLRPFIYRRYLDYGAYQAMRQMKQLIQQEVARRGLEHNIKLGRGGIREVEFIAQVFQLIRGGRLPQFQERSLLKVLELLGRHRSLPEEVCAKLAQAYVFLRNVEHRLQEFGDHQTHELPKDGEGRVYLALAMGYDDWSAFKRVLEMHRQRVQSYFDQVFAAPQAVPDLGGEGAPVSPLGSVWYGTLDERQSLEVMQAAGFDAAEDALEQIVRLRDAYNVRLLSHEGRERLERLMPLLLGAVARSPGPTATLKRVLAVVEAIARRTAYLALLVENPMALSQLVRLCAASPWITRLLGRHPVLLDELLDPRALYAPLERSQLREELRSRLAAIPEDDLEQQMETLRQFKQTQALRVAAADVAGILPLRRVSDYLTAVAEVILESVLGLALSHLEARYGRPCYRDGAEIMQAGFAIVGYGKLGGIELGYGSDLDLVFLHDSKGDAQLTDGPRSIENYLFFSRLAQRIIHILTAHTPAGVLYEVDVRLRPSGASGLLVSSLEAFSDYQRTHAWTWEHQALVRARPVAGCDRVAQGFSAVRAGVLSRERDAEAVREEVCAMRERMRAAEGGSARGWFDLKQGPGGIVDIEFLAQYGVLRWASSHPELLGHTATLRFLDEFARTGLLASADAERLSDAYGAYRSEVHRLTLQEEPARVCDEQFRSHREGVNAIWDNLLRC